MAKTKPEAIEMVRDQEKPNPNIKWPEYMVVTEGFDPPEVGRIIRKFETENQKLKTKNGC